MILRSVCRLTVLVRCLDSTPLHGCLNELWHAILCLVFYIIWPHRKNNSSCKRPIIANRSMTLHCLVYQSHPKVPINPSSNVTIRKRMVFFVNHRMCWMAKPRKNPLTKRNFFYGNRGESCENLIMKTKDFQIEWFHHLNWSAEIQFKWIIRLQSVISNSNWLRTSHCNCKWIFGPLHTMKWILTSADYNIRCRRIFPSLEKQINIIDIQFKSMAGPEFIGHICCLNQSHHNCHQLLNSWFSNDIQSGAHCLFAWTLPWNDPGHLEKIPSSALYVNSSYRMIMRRYLLLCSA